MMKLRRAISFYRLRWKMPDEESGENTPLLNGETRPRSVPRYVGAKMCAILGSSWVNVLLVFVPFGIMAKLLGWGDLAIFFLNFAAIIPLAQLMNYATEQIAAHVGETMGGLINASFGNAVELIVSFIALYKGEIRVVQASMLGSILSNILLVLGLCFLAGGLVVGGEQKFNSTAASTMSSLMAVATSSLVIPAALSATLPEEDTNKMILSLSRATAIIMLVLYLLYLYFQLASHGYIFADVAGEEGDPEEHAELSQPEGYVLLALVAVVVAVCAEYLVGSIEGLVAKTSMSKTFIGLILVPIVGNAAEHLTAVSSACKGKMDLAIGVAIGSSMQIALLVTPVMVIAGWILGQAMTLRFLTFETVIFFVSTYLSYLVVADGKSNYLEGAMLLGLYAIICVSFWVYPDGSHPI